MEHNDSPDAFVANGKRRGGVRMVDERVARLEVWMDNLSKKVDSIEVMVRETRDMLFELRGRQKNGSNVVGVLKDIIMALIGAILGILGIKATGG